MSCGRVRLVGRSGSKRTPKQSKRDLVCDFGRHQTLVQQLTSCVLLYSATKRTRHVVIVRRANATVWATTRSSNSSLVPRPFSPLRLRPPPTRSLLRHPYHSRIRTVLCRATPPLRVACSHLLTRDRWSQPSFSRLPSTLLWASGSILSPCHKPMDRRYNQHEKVSSTTPAHFEPG